MKKLALILFLLLNVTNPAAFADCVTGYACSLRDLNKNDTNSVVQNELEKDKIQNEKDKIINEKDKKSETEKQQLPSEKSHISK